MLSYKENFMYNVFGSRIKLEVNAYGCHEYVSRLRDNFKVSG
jgi:hypothetical protein